MLIERSRILLIDDEAVVCEGCHIALSDRGYLADSCNTGKDGIEALSKRTYDAVLLDMKLPDMDGMEILRFIKRETPQAYVIVMTGYASVKNAVEAMKLGAFDYLAKPFTDDEMTLSVEKALENKQLKEENRALRHQLSERFDFDNIIGETPKVVQIFDAIKKAAPTDSTVLLYGESGTGKELFARAIHAHSKRASRQFIAVDCSTFSSSLLESELFGHIKGAFTGADHDQAGIFEMAKGGTLFLDEVANLNVDIQAKFLRVMETREYKPVGASQLKTSDVRVIAATNQNLKSMVADRTFREDFFYRLNVVPIFIPALRERKEDIPKLLYHFLKVYRRKIGKRVDGFSDDALEMLLNYDWPGNVRQLKNVVERLVIMADQNVLDSPYLSLYSGIQQSRCSDGIPDTLKELKSMKKNWLNEQFGGIEKAFLCKALAAENGIIAHAAKRVGMQRSNFSALMKKHHLTAN